MELGDGKDLFTEVSRQLQEGRRVAESEAAMWFAQILQGVTFVHGMGICHRDLKLENVLLHSDGTVKLADFGMSKDFSQSIVETRSQIGTLAYLAPELFDNSGDGAYAPEPVDVWALGVMLFIMTVGDYPFGTEQVIRSTSLPTIFLQAPASLRCSACHDFANGGRCCYMVYLLLLVANRLCQMANMSQIRGPGSNAFAI